jgi:hypothetical protein
MVKSIYSSVRLRVKAGGVLSDAFDNLLGVKQGEPIHPLLFLFFINDIIDDISTDCQDKRKNQEFEVRYCHKRNDHLPAASYFEKQLLWFCQC